MKQILPLITSPEYEFTPDTNVCLSISGQDCYRSGSTRLSQSGCGIVIYLLTSGYIFTLHWSVIIERISLQILWFENLSVDTQWK